MSFYELNAEKKGYCHFQHRSVPTMNAHFHSAPEFVFVEKGELDVILSGEKRTLTSGQACFIDGFCVHAYATRPDLLAFVLLGDKQYFSPYFSDLQGKPPAFFPFENFPLLSSLFTLFEQNEGGRCATFRGAVGILLGEIAQTVPFSPVENERQHSLVCELLRYAENHLCDDLSLSALSKKFGYSHEHLSRVLHTQLIETWNAYVNRLRVHRARQMLLAGGGNVLKIAYECGFESPNTFYRAYKKEFGKSPKSQSLT